MDDRTHPFTIKDKHIMQRFISELFLESKIKNVAISLRNACVMK